MSQNECKSLVNITKASNGILLYRATRDGFESKEFHSRCDGKTNTITIIKNNLDYVFGGYASVAWNSSNKYIKDQNAFLFSLRRNGVSFQDKFMIVNQEKALYGGIYYGPTFSDDVCIFNQSNLNYGLFSTFGSTYYVPVGNAKNYLGDYQWLTTEIEVYQIY